MRILFEPLAGALGLGPVTRCLAIAQEAAIRGHEVAFLAPPLYPLVDEFDLGRRFVAPTPVKPEGLTPAEIAGEAECYPHALAMRGLCTAEYLRAAVRSELETFDAFRPDVVVTEMQPTVGISARAAGIPFAVTAATPYLDAYARPGGLEATRWVQELFVGIAAEFDVPATSVEQVVHGGAALNIAPTVPELEPALAELPNAGYFGPVLSSRQELSPAPEVQGVVRVLVYLGTGIVTPEELIPELLEAFPADRYGVLVAARSPVVAGREAPAWFDNVLVAHHPGITRALTRTDIFVNRCGQNAMAASLLAGVPMIGVPGNSAEPLFNLAALEEHGAATTLHGSPDAPALVEAVRQLDDIRAHEHAVRLGDRLREYPGVPGVVRALEQLVA